jgi:hypothetical protein
MPAVTGDGPHEDVAVHGEVADQRLPRAEQPLDLGDRQRLRGGQRGVVGELLLQPRRDGGYARLHVGALPAQVLLSGLVMLRRRLGDGGDEGLVERLPLPDEVLPLAHGLGERGIAGPEPR